MGEGVSYHDTLIHLRCELLTYGLCGARRKTPNRSLTSALGSQLLTVTRLRSSMQRASIGSRDPFLASFQSTRHPATPSTTIARLAFTLHRPTAQAVLQATKTDHIIHAAGKADASREDTPMISSPTVCTVLYTYLSIPDIIVSLNNNAFCDCEFVCPVQLR
jgi:hypothetical protein